MKILVISSNLIGDTILSTGVIKYFSNKNPEAKFTFVIGPSAKSIFKNFKSVENIITVSKKNYNNKSAFPIQGLRPMSKSLPYGLKTILKKDILDHNKEIKPIDILFKKIENDN